VRAMKRKRMLICFPNELELQRWSTLVMWKELKDKPYYVGIDSIGQEWHQLVVRTRGDIEHLRGQQFTDFFLDRISADLASSIALICRKDYAPSL
jgi:hypothetical protein